MNQEFLKDVLLEVECWNCEGDGCEDCNQSGFLPTDLGRKVLELVKHNPIPKDETF